MTSDDSGAAALPTLLSQVLVAFTIEFDNEFEHRMPHRTAACGPGDSPGGPWLVSLPMWANFMQHVDPDGTPMHVLADRARIVNLGGLQRWGYVRVEAEPGTDGIVVPTRAGARARTVWAPLAAEIERRWTQRHGDLGPLRALLVTVLDRLGPGLPEGLPVVPYADGMRAPRITPATATPTGSASSGPTTAGSTTSGPTAAGSAPAGSTAAGSTAAGSIAAGPSTSEPTTGTTAPTLPALLSRTLLAFALEHEARTEVSMTIGATVLRVLDGDVALREVPSRCGVAKEATTAAVNFLQRKGYVELLPNPAARGKVVHLTESGRRARDTHSRVRADVERRWRDELGAEDVDAVRAALRGIVEARDGGRPLLAAGLVPRPEAWRAQRPYLSATRAVLADPAAALPHHPVVTHRGGYPDGA